jgi:hypothetical protein
MGAGFFLLRALVCCLNVCLEDGKEKGNVVWTEEENQSKATVSSSERGA